MIELKSKRAGITPKVILGLGTSELKQQEDRKIDPENKSIWSDPNISRVIFKDKNKA